MRTVEISRLFAENQERLELQWVAGRDGGERTLSRDTNAQADVGLVGHMNFIHPFRVQLIGPAEMAYLSTLPLSEQASIFARLLVDELGAIFVCGVGAPLDYMKEQCDKAHVPLMQSPLPSPQVLEMGVLITGASAIGKSELALELISRGHGLIADDIVEVYKVATDLIEGRCPEVLKDFLEVRGIGILNVRTTFGETAVRPRKSLKLIVHLEDHTDEQFKRLDRMSVNATYQEILGVKIRKMIIPVAAGRNLAVLVETAVRNFVLNLRGIDSTREFIERQAKLMEEG